MTPEEVGQEDPSNTKPKAVSGAKSVERQLLGSKNPEIDELIAFSLYYKERREWEEAYEQVRGVKPSEGDLEIFDMAWSKMKIDALRGDANRVLRAYAQDVSERALQLYKNKSDINDKMLSRRFIIVICVAVICSVFGNLLASNVENVFQIVGNTIENYQKLR